MDADTGFGNYNNVRKLVKKVEKIKLAGICIEDKIFPKINSFLDGANQKLTSISEFCGKIKAAKDTQLSSDFCVVARTEAFVTGFDVQEALKRATHYIEAGADAILVHSKLSTADQIKEFMQYWQNSAPIIIVPTTYESTPTSLFSQLGVSMVIWANHNLRASILAMRKVSQKLHTNQTISAIKGDISTLEDVFDLTATEELQKSEELYLNHLAK